MKKNIICLTLFFCSIITAYANPEYVRKFYYSYMCNVVEGNSNNESLCRSYMDGGLILKMERVSTASGTDAIIRAQDVSSDAIESLSVEELGNDWYMLRYRWQKNTPETEIPLKAEKVDGKCKIVYITPYWSGIAYGNELIYGVENGCMDKVVQSSGREFIQTFYNSYLSEYYKMSEDIGSSLSKLRAEYLTVAAMSQFDCEKGEHLSDGQDGYDLLIDNYDFDYTWRDSIAIVGTGHDEYLFMYQVDDKLYRLKIKLVRHNGSFYIDNISISK